VYASSVEPSRARILRRLRLTLSLVSVFIGVGISVASADELKPFTATYAWVWHGLTVAVTTVELQKSSGDTWTYRSHSEPRGIYKLIPMRPKLLSVLRITDSGVQPLSYTASDGTSSKKRAIDVKYDWERGRITGVYEETPVDLALKPGVQDDNSAQIALMVERLRGHTPEKFLLLDKNEIREYLYSQESETTLETPVGHIATIVYRSQRPGSQRANRYWCAPDRGYIPLRVEQKVDDDVQWTMKIEGLKRE